MNTYGLFLLRKESLGKENFYTFKAPDNFTALTYAKHILLGEEEIPYFGWEISYSTDLPDNTKYLSLPPAIVNDSLKKVFLVKIIKDDFDLAGLREKANASKKLSRKERNKKKAKDLIKFLMEKNDITKEEL